MNENTSKGVLPIALVPKKTLLIGAGSVAKQKYQVLLEAGFEVNIIAKEIKEAIFYQANVCLASIDIVDFVGFEAKNPRQYKNLNEILCENRSEDLPHLSPNVLEGFELIIDASGDNALGEFLYKNRKKYGYLLNVVDVPRFCDFYFGAIVRRENIAVMVSSNGASPILAQHIRDKIAHLLPKTLGKFANFLQKTRTKPLSIEQKEQIKQQCKENLGKVFIIGCGPGDFSSLTLRAYEALSIIDVALIDNLVGKEIWEFLESLGVECISVGKQKGKHSFKQKDINTLMLELARAGKCVGRIKGGDPVIFGRVWEEGSFLHKNGIEVTCISGLSSSLCGALSSGIVPTLRGVSSGVLIVSAHLRESIFHAEWLHWLKDSPYTLIVMMAHSFAHRIIEEARNLGIDLSMNAAFVSKVDSLEQKSVIGTLGQLEKMAELCDAPAILIIGKVVQNSLEMPYQGERIVLEPQEGQKDIAV